LANNLRIAIYVADPISNVDVQLDT